MAIVVLLLSALLGARVGKSVARTHRLPNGIVTLSVTTFITALIFFIWALTNTITGDNLDGGTVSFPIALLASIYGYGSLSPCLDVTRWVYRVTAVCGYAAVSCNYIYIISIVGNDLGAAFLLYLFIGAIYWGCAAALSTCVDIVPKSLGTSTGAAYQKIPGGIRV